MTFASGTIWFSDGCPTGEGVSQFGYTATAGDAYAADYL
jgi:hypothetical protein